MDDSILKISGSKPGKTVAVFAGIHGNEKAGVMALEKVIRGVKITAGTVYFVLANPPAIEANTRMIKKNLNRLFLANNRGRSWEDIRARELMKVLDSCDALLDLHGYNSPEDTPFAITDGPGLEVTKIFDVDKVVVGIDPIVPGGTDGYMLKAGKIGICLECGSNSRPEQYVGLAKKTVYQFLQYYGLLESKVSSSQKKQRVFKVVSMVKKQTAEFAFDKPYANFDVLTQGSVFATDGPTKYIAKKNQSIIFPRPDTKIGQDVFTVIKLYAHTS